MQQSLKKKIAKEIIIFFASIFVIGLIWTTFWIVNNFNARKAASATLEIQVLENYIDSIKFSIPKEKIEFEDILSSENVPENFYKEYGEGEIDFSAFDLKLQKHDPLELLDTYDNTTASDNIRKLFSFLEKTNFPFQESPFSKYDTLNFKDFQNDIVKELKIATINVQPEKIKKNIKKIETDNIAARPKFYKIFTFLNEKKYLKVNFDWFVYTFDESILPIHFSTWAYYQSALIKEKELKSKLLFFNSKINASSILIEKAKWICIIILLIAYPLRWSTALLIWAFKTIKN